MERRVKIGVLGVDVNVGLEQDSDNRLGAAEASQVQRGSFHVRLQVGIRFAFDEQPHNLFMAAVNGVMQGCPVIEALGVDIKEADEFLVFLCCEASVAAAVIRLILLGIMNLIF